MLRKIKHFIGRRYKAFLWLYHEFKILINHLGSSNNNESQEKMIAILIMESHIIEKGLSLKHVKIGFGESKVLSLLRTLNKYFDKYKDKEMMFFVLSLVESYIDYNKKKGHENIEILGTFEKLRSLIADINIENLKGGVIHLSKAEIQSYANINYEDFVKSRHSIRDFTGRSIDEEKIIKALEIAAYTPSACNRQPWGNYIYFDKKKIIEILEFQTGARQFKDEISCLILVTSNYNSFFGGEFHQPYVNGGMYAMNLIFALHSTGLGTIPLNLGLDYSKLKKLKIITPIKDNEVPIMLIGIGDISENLNVAASKRFSYTNYTKFYK